MENDVNIEDRKPIWIALSDFYLDTTLQASNIKYIAQTILQSPYTLEQVKKINKYEVFPVLHINFSSVAGEWTGFEEKWLVDTILRNLQRRNRLNKWSNEIFYFYFRNHFNEDWKAVTESYNELNT